MRGYEIGNQVVCIHDSWMNQMGEKFNSGPKLGQVLTIKDIVDYRPFSDELGLRFHELSILTLVGEATFTHTQFRPVRKTSIECFTNMLVTDKEKV